MNKKVKKYTLITAIFVIILIGIIVVIYNETKEKEYMFLNPSQSLEVKEYIDSDEMPLNSKYSIKFISKSINGYKLYYVYDGQLLIKEFESDYSIREDFIRLFDNNKIDGSTICVIIAITCGLIEVILLIYILIGKYEKMNSKLKSVLFCIFSFIMYLVAFVYIPMISKNYGQKIYTYLIFAILYITSFIWGYKRKSVFRFALLELIPFYIGTLFNYSNSYLGNARIDINNIGHLFDISQISNTISFVTIIFSYYLIGICGGIVGRFYKYNKIEKIHIVGNSIFTLGFVVLLIIRIFVKNTLSIIASRAIELMLPAVILSFVLILVKYIYKRSRKNKLIE